MHFEKGFDKKGMWGNFFWPYMTNSVLLKIWALISKHNCNAPSCFLTTTSVAIRCGYFSGSQTDLRPLFFVSLYEGCFCDLKVVQCDVADYIWLITMILIIVDSSILFISTFQGRQGHCPDTFQNIKCDLNNTIQIKRKGIKSNKSK